MRGIIFLTAATSPIWRATRISFDLRSLGTMYFETDQLYCVERGQIGLVDCRRPHHFYTKGDAEALWIHFDGANAAAFSSRYSRSAAAGRRLRRRRILRHRAGAGTDHFGLRTGDMTELDCSQRIYRILCALLFPAQAGPDRKTMPLHRRSSISENTCLNRCPWRRWRMRSA